MRGRGRKKRLRRGRDTFPLRLFKRNMPRLHARNRNCGLRRTMERRQSLLLLSPERLTTALSYPPEPQGLLTILQLIEPPCGHRAMLQPSNREMQPHVPTSLCRIIGQNRTELIPIAPRRRSRITGPSPIVRSRAGPNRIVRPQFSRMNGRSLTDRLQRSRTTDQSRTAQNRVGPNRTDRPQPSRNYGPNPIALQCSRTIGLSLTGLSLLSGRKRLRRTSVRSPSTLLLLRKHDLHRNSDRSRRRKRKSSRTNSQRGMRSRHSR